MPPAMLTCNLLWQYLSCALDNGRLDIAEHGPNPLVLSPSRPKEPSTGHQLPERRVFGQVGIGVKGNKGKVRPSGRINNTKDIIMVYVMACSTVNMNLEVSSKKLWLNNSKTMVFSNSSPSLFRFTNLKRKYRKTRHDAKARSRRRN